ncbi:hypothetical protein A0H81_03518 [Grifola frondosa]|nr:hypothetical protein A0H81_03518 [Grifola frondosa]
MRRMAAKRKNRKTLVRELAETADEAQLRRSEIPTRIRNWMKNTIAKKKKPVELPVPPVPSARSTPRKVTALDVYKSTHPDRPKVEIIEGRDGRMRANLGKFASEAKVRFEQLDDADKAALDAEARSRSAGQVNEGGLQDDDERARKSAALPQWMEATAKSWEAQTGWIGYFILGGVDAAGKLQAYATNTGIDSTGANFEERLARVLRWDKDDIRTKFWEYLADVFKRPMPVADDAMKPLTTVRSQSPPGCSPGETHGPQTVVETTSQQLAHLLTPAPRVASPAIPVPSVVGTSGASPLTPAPPSSTPVLFLHTPTSAIPAPSAATLPIASDGMKKKSRQKAKKSKKSKTSTAADKTAMEITQRMNASARVARAKVATTKIAVAKAVAAEVAGAKASRSVESQILRSSRERRPSSRSLGEDPLMTTVARAKRQRTDGIEDASALKKRKTRQ